MSDSDFPLLADDGVDDLPRTLRREREAREREAREREAKARAATLTHDFGAMDAPYEPRPAAPLAAPARQLDVPFFRLVVFFIKAVFAAIPALILLVALLWLSGEVLRALFPWLLQMQILIHFPD